MELKQGFVTPYPPQPPEDAVVHVIYNNRIVPLYHVYHGWYHALDRAQVKEGFHLHWDAIKKRDWYKVYVEHGGYPEWN